MNKLIFLIVLIMVFFIGNIFAVGVNLSYFLPYPFETGYLGIPVPPLSFNMDFLTIVPEYATLGFDVGLMFMPAYSLAGLNFTLTAPALGPSTALDFGLTLKLSLPISIVTISAIGGGFTFYYFDLKLNKGNFDRDLMNDRGWDSLTSDLAITNNWGLGYKFGGEVSIEIMPKVQINIGGMYYYGEATTPISGTITGGITTITTEDYSATGAKTLYTGIMLMVGGAYEL